MKGVKITSKIFTLFFSILKASFTDIEARMLRVATKRVKQLDVITPGELRGSTPVGDAV